MGTPKILIYDIENAMNLGGYFGRKYDVNISKVIQTTYVFGFAYKWVGEKGVKSCYIWDYDLYDTEPRNDSLVIEEWCRLVEEADIIVGHNVDAFDTKVMTGRMLVHHLPPLSMPQSVDTWKQVRRIARFDSNKLDDVCTMLGFGKKLPTDANLWWDCMIGDEKAQKQMVKYNKQDVVLTEKLYQYLAPYDRSHPNVATILGRPELCPRCGESGQLTAQGVRHTKVGTYRQWKCNSCLSWSRSRLAEKVDRPTRV